MTVYLNQRENSRDAIIGKIMYSREHNGNCYNARLKNCTNKGMELITEFPYLKKQRSFYIQRTRMIYQFKKLRLHGAGLKVMGMASNLIIIGLELSLLAHRVGGATNKPPIVCQHYHLVQVLYTLKLPTISFRTLARPCNCSVLFFICIQLPDISPASEFTSPISPAI